MQRIMSTKSAIYIPFTFLLGLFMFSSCLRDDAEPIGGVRQFTRLYVSFEEAPVVNSTTPYINIGVVYPADSTDIFEFSLSYGSNAVGGGPLFFNPYASVLFQASANLNGVSDTVVYNMNVGTTGVLSNSGLTGNRYYTYVKGLAYYANSNMLFVVNGNGTTNSRIQVEQNPVGRQTYRGPLKRYFTSGKLLWGAAYYNDRLFVSQLNAPIGITIFDNVVSTDVSSSSDSSATLDSYTLPIAGAESGVDLRGLSYAPEKDILVLAAFATGTTTDQGRIYIFENFSEQLTGAAHTITPTRTIMGTATLLDQPVEVAIDSRTNGIYLYVADRQARRIFRFNINDDGNVAPNQEIGTPNNRIPVGLALDTRDVSTLDNTTVSTTP